MGAGESVEARLAPYDYALPSERIAFRPPAQRDGGRLLVAAGSGWRDSVVRDLPSLLAPGDVLVVNDTRVLSARLRARRATGGAVELLLLEDQGLEVPAMVRPGRKLKDGEILTILDGDLQPLDEMQAVIGTLRSDGSRMVRLCPGPAEVMMAAGQVPLPPYIDRTADEDDALRYQTVYADQPGAVAAPTAGLHLTDEIFQRLRDRGVVVARCTLHVGPGTFRNLREEDLERGSLHLERFHLPQATANAIAQARSCGGRVVAVGTTVTRTLESQARPGGLVTPGSGTTDLFIRPGHRFQVVDALLTNFHLPRTSLLMLVCALGGRDRVLAGYRHAVAAEYRFYSYGDAMFLTDDSSSDGR